MTIEFPDVSEYTPNVDPAQYPALLARATLSTSYVDPTYAGFKAKAAGRPFVAYHWLNHGNLAAQAAWCFQHVGPDTPVMIDAEDVAGNTGYNGPLTVADMVGFAAAYRSLGGIVSLIYLPFWYWAGPMGAPHQLDALTAAGLGLVSSNYPAAGYTDNGPGWAPYYPGAPAPVQWQYTSTPIDMNAFKGTAEQYAALIGTPRKHQGETMLLSIVLPDGSNKDGFADGLGGWWHIADITALAAAEAAAGVALPYRVPVAVARAAFNIQMDDSGNVAVPSPVPVDTHALATDLETQLQAAGFPTQDGMHAALKSVLDAKFGAAAAA